MQEHLFSGLDHAGAARLHIRFGLRQIVNGQCYQMHALAPLAERIGDIAVLDEELMQSDRYMNLP